MQNHGITVHDNNPNVCLAIQTDANARLAKFFGLAVTSFPEVCVKKMAGGLYAANTLYPKECTYSQKELPEQPL